ncbi:FAD-dependent oxidoreductase [Xanthobacter oligotrophicus]|uniref:FAD-dependent oxidoreductase n=1 Tax=Xanthobacter oligotrophicus TaxID=2607286 RepID=UPI00165DE7B4|nr:FAD-dependent oxidoreductase [Xanthobacter oligotrophicus]MCG5236590.1 FAD-dependent oxidoreductase [Xanthobacter oligotrophicus]
MPLEAEAFSGESRDGGLATDSDRIVIVGAGQAGARAAEALRTAGHKGAITLVGDEPHLPYERPQLSKEVLLAPKGEVAFVKTAEAWHDLGVELCSGVRVAECDVERRTATLESGRTLIYDKLLLATGTSARRLPALETGQVPVRYLRTIDDAMALRTHLAPGAAVVLVGGGVIGLEVAAAAVAAGASATVIEAGHSLLVRALPTVASDFLLRRHRVAGVEFRFGVTVSSVEDGVLLLSDGARISASVVVVGVGADPHAGLAAQMGLAGEGGIEVDPFGRTSAEGVFAAGDITLQRCPRTSRWRRVETWANAQNQAIAVARTMAGVPTAYTDPTWFWSDQYDVNLQVVGELGVGDLVARGDVGADRFTLVALDEGIVRGAVTVNRRPDMAALRKLVASGVRVDRANIENPSFDLRKALA